MKTKIKSKSLIAFGLIFAQVLSGCLGSATDEADDTEGADATTEGSELFPSSLAVASPFDVTENTESASSSLSGLAETELFVTRYAWAAGRIEMILNGDSPDLCRFDPELYLTRETDAGCFGPTVTYEAHPDALSPADFGYDGQLPSGDIGLFAAEDAATGNSCSAAELNARMEGVRDKSVTSLMGLASLVCVMNVNGIAAPENASEDLTDEMNDLGIVGVTFADAEITHDDSSGSDEWSYALDFEYDGGSDLHHIVVAMTHLPTGTPFEYQGRLSYRVNNQFTGGNCPTADVTDNGSLLYEMNGADDLKIEVRQGSFCEHDSDGLTAGLVDPGDKYDAASNPTGWGNNFSILTANFDPSGLAGDYAYSWQAGPGDLAARVFNVHVEADATSGDPIGSAFFAYGDDIEESDGSILGFICNWAGPQSDHTLQSLAQSQELSYDSATGLFVADSSELSYAPTNSCEYDGSGAFSYDSDGDNVVDTDPATAIANELTELNDSDTDSVWDEIAESGFTPPTSPSNL